MKRNLWKNDKVQFARLIWEAEAAGAFKHHVGDIAISMDLEVEEVHEIIDRAIKMFENEKTKICKRGK